MTDWQPFSCRRTPHYNWIKCVLLNKNLQIVYFNAAVGSAQPVKIDEWAFLGCDKLEEITLPPTGAYNEIDGEAFKGCVNLKRIYNAPSYLDMGDEQSVEEVSFAEGLTYINGIDTTEWTKMG